MKKALDTTIKNIAKMILEIKNKAENIESSSEALYNISQEMTVSSNEVASSIQETAKGSSTQAGSFVHKI